MIPCRLFDECISLSFTGVGCFPLIVPKNSLVSSVEQLACKRFTIKATSSASKENFKPHGEGQWKRNSGKRGGSAGLKSGVQHKTVLAGEKKWQFCALSWHREN